MCFHDEIRNHLLAWFSREGRTFIWRSRPTPFNILVAEILLRKTGAEVVNRFLPAFLSRFPKPSMLATVDPQELTTFLSPLGLSRQRADQLKRLGEILTELTGGKVPNSRCSLLVLPGVGEYTAAAVLCFAYGRVEALVDTNVARIVLRVHGIAQHSHYEARRSPEVWDRARNIIGENKATAKSLNWALLDLGAMVCKSRDPKCAECPLQELCAYAKTR